MDGDIDEKKKALKTVYLDYNATTPLEPSVIDAIQSTLSNHWRNPSSSYIEGKLAKAVIEEAREHVAKMVHGSQSEIVFVSGGTEANVLVFHSIIEEANACHHGDTFKPPHIILSNIEHDSIALVADSLSRKGQIEVTCVSVSKKTGRVAVDDILAAIKPNTRLVTIMHANNETGILQPVASIVSSIKEVNSKRKLENLPHIYVHTDAAQAIGKIPVNVAELGVDYLTIVGHKFYAPRIGALWTRDLGTAKSAPLHPMFIGGGQERGYRAGTENTPMIAGLGEAARLVNDNLEEYASHMKQVRDYLEECLEKTFTNRVHFNSKFMGSARLPNTCNFSLLGKNMEGHKILKRVSILQASVGAACHSDKETKPSHILIASGIPEDVARNALRLSVGRHTTKKDIDTVIWDLKNVVETLSV